MASITAKSARHETRPRRWLGLLASALLLAGPVAAQPEEEHAPGETEIKAAFVYKFTGYAEWPRPALGEADSPLVIGVAGADDIAAELRRIVSGRTVRDRPVNVRTVNSASDVAGVHVLFIGSDAGPRMARFIEAARNRPILVISDAPDGLERGAMINFVMVKRRVQFEIAVEPAEKAGLALSSRLLAVAFRVKKGGLGADTHIAQRATPALAACAFACSGKKKSAL